MGKRVPESAARRVRRPGGGVSGPRVGPSVTAILHRGVARRVITLAVALVCAGLGPAGFVLSPARPVGPTVRVALVQPGDITDSAASRPARSSPPLWRASIRTWSCGERAASVSTSAALRSPWQSFLTCPDGSARAFSSTSTHARREGESTSRPTSSDPTGRWARTRKPGWCPSASTYPYARCSAGFAPARQPA